MCNKNDFFQCGHPKKEKPKDDDTQPKRKHGLNWVEVEVTHLSAFCCENSEVLEAELSGSSCQAGKITAKKQADLWKEITNILNG